MKVKELAKVYSPLLLLFDDIYISYFDIDWQSDEQNNDVLKKYGDSEIDWLVPSCGQIEINIKKGGNKMIYENKDERNIFMKRYELQKVIVKNNKTEEDTIVFMSEDRNEVEIKMNLQAESILQSAIFDKWGIKDDIYMIDYRMKKKSCYITRKTIVNEKVVYEIEYRYLIREVKN